MRMPRPSHATVVAYLALIAATGGTASAAVLINGGQVKDGTLTSRDVAQETLTGANVKNLSLTGREIAVGALNSGHVRDGALTGVDIKLGSIPLDRLAGPLPAGTAGPVTTQAVTRDVSGNDVPLLTVPGWATLTLQSCVGSNAIIALNRGDVANRMLLWTESSATPGGTYSDNFWVVSPATSGTAGWARYTVAKGAGSLEVTVHYAKSGSTCSVSAAAELRTG